MTVYGVKRAHSVRGIERSEVRVSQSFFYPTSTTFTLQGSLLMGFGRLRATFRKGSMETSWKANCPFGEAQGEKGREGTYCADPKNFSNRGPADGVYL